MGSFAAHHLVHHALTTNVDGQVHPMVDHSFDLLYITYLATAHPRRFPSGLPLQQ